MSRLAHKRTGLALRKQRIQRRVKGTTTKPRLSVFVSNRHISAQIVDDSSSKTIASVNSLSNTSLKGSMSEKAQWAGAEIAKKAKVAKVTEVIFDRNGKLYHGRVKELADAARQEGLEF